MKCICSTEYVGEQWETQEEQLVSRFHVWKCSKCHKLYYYPIKETTNDEEKFTDISKKP